jgi:hypothetical protein
MEEKFKDIDEYLRLPSGSFDKIPGYVKQSAKEAIYRVREMERKTLFRPGLYYILLIDMIESTKLIGEVGHEIAKRKIEWFITACVETLGQIRPENFSLFVKDIGDATLFIFSSIDDLLNWIEVAEENFQFFGSSKLFVEHFKDNPDVGGKSLLEINTRKVIHLGEVRYHDKSDPISLAISQIFKIEKSVGKNEIGCTDIVARTIKPYLNDRSLTLVKKDRILIPNDNEESILWLIK